MFWNVLQIQIFFFFSNNYPVEIKLQQRTAKKALAAFFDVLFFCLRVCLHLRDFRIFGQPHNIIHRLSSFLMVGLNLTTKFLISEKIPFFWSFGTIFPDGGSIIFSGYLLLVIMRKRLGIQTMQVSCKVARNFFGLLPNTAAE